MHCDQKNWGTSEMDMNMLTSTVALGKLTLKTQPPVSQLQTGIIRLTTLGAIVKVKWANVSQEFSTGLGK